MATLGDCGPSDFSRAPQFGVPSNPGVFAVMAAGSRSEGGTTAPGPGARPAGWLASRTVTVPDPGC